VKVELVNRTVWALETLLYTKNTRLQGEQTFDDIIAWPEEKKLEHLEYMRDTIQSSWEFVDYVFKISRVSRAFTHQLVRTRTASFAQESQRTVDVRDHAVINTCSEEYQDQFDAAIGDLMGCYENMIEDGMPIQDARGILPTNIETSIIVKLNLRTLHDMALLRLCTRTQGEYQRAFKLMRDCVIEAHPWAAQFIKVYCAWYGSCAFPRYKECPVKNSVSVELDAQRKREYAERWERTEHEAVPVAEGGMTQ
jgi:flavin-dependent thymidylate synthase